MVNTKIKAIFKISLFLCSLINFLNGQTPVKWMNYDHNQNFVEEDFSNTVQQRTFALQFDDSKTKPFYVKVTVTPLNGDPTPVLCFSNKDQNCLSDRLALVRRTDGKPINLYAKREQIQNQDQELYVQVTCPKTGCSYKVRFDGEQSASIEPNTVYSYLVDNFNKEMIFEVLGTAEEDSFLTIGLEGSSSATITIDGVEKSPYAFDNGKVLTYPLNNNNSRENASVMSKFTIKNGNVGEFLTLSVHVVTDSLVEENFLYPNGPVVMGTLDKTEGYFTEECFPVTLFTSDKYKNINKYYLTGTIHSKYALFWMADENGMYMEETEMEINDGFLSYFIQTNGKVRSICFEFSYEETVHMDNVAYSISILEPTTLEDTYNFYLPQANGQFYRRMLQKGGMAVFHAGKIQTSDKKYTYNLYNRKGVAEMYIGKCTKYPECKFTLEELPSLTYPKRVNKMAVYDTTVEKSGTIEALDSSSNVMIVYCRDDDNEEKGFCEFDTSIFAKPQTITLVENEKFSKYVVKGDTGTFKIDLKGGVQIQRLTVDIMIFSGDVSFNIRESGNKLNAGKLGDEDIDLNYFKYFLSNKIFFHFNFAQLKMFDLEIEFKAELNSFFTIQYGMHSHNLNQLQENILSDESYLVQIDPTSNEKAKTVFLSNYRYKMEKPFLANFFALNCEFQVTRGENEITFFDGYAQEILSSNSQGYKSENYEYKIKIIEPDLSNYNHKMCMLYVSGYESQDDKMLNEIVIGENVNQQVIFDDNFKSVRFLYPESDPSKDLALYVNVIDKAIYRVRVYVNNREDKLLRDITVTRSQIYYIAGDELPIFCEIDSLCNIIVQVEWTDTVAAMPKTNPMIEVTVRQILNTPSYLQKGIAKKDFTCGDRFYYLYTDIGKNEAGEVSVNFLRDFGNVWGKVVRKDQTSIDDDANWRGIYRMPSDDWEDGLPYNGYIKKFSVGVEQTQDCIEGCYLLLSIRVSQIGEYVDDYKFYPFTIITRITPNNHAYTDIPKVVIQVDEYVIGNVDLAENERIYEFYQVWLPHDSYMVQFDWQSEIAGLYINIGDTRPTTKNADFKLLPPGRDSILSIDKFEILEKAKNRKIKIPYENSIQDLSLTIGIWTDKLDSVETEVYSLKVHQPNEDEEIDIMEVNTDQKLLCSPRFINDNQYRCLFMITFDDEDVFLEMPLLVYGQSLNHSAITHTYASFIERDYYDRFDVKTLKSSIPTSETAKYSTLRDDVEYIYTTLNPKDAGEKKYYLYVSVVADREYDIMIMTSLPMYNVISPTDHEFYPNPSTEQLLSVQGERLRLKFFTSSSIIVNIVTLGGEADIKWVRDNENVYNLRGRGDRLSLTSGETIDEIIITRRKTDSSYLDKAGFVFYVSYFIRDPKINFDNVEYGKSLEISYRQTDLPVVLYSKIGTYYNDISIAFTFKDSNIDNEGEYNYSPFTIRGALARESTVYKAKLNPELAPSLEKTIYGSYDMALKTAQVFFSDDFIQSLNLKESDNPTLYLSVEKSAKTSDKKYQKFNVETQFSKVNDGVIPVEKTFNYGRFGGYYVNYYRLKVDLRCPIMKIEIAFNSENLDFALSTSVSRTNNSAMITKIEKDRGRTLLTVKPISGKEVLYLNIFQKDRFAEYDLSLNNYVFKYVNIMDEKNFTEYRILDNDGKLSITEEEIKDSNETKITCTFNKLDIEKGKANVTYFFKVVDNETHIYGESYETIAVMESPFYTVYKRNPEDTNGKISLTAKGVLSNWVYLQVIAQIQQDTVLEYVAYKGVFNLRPPKEGYNNNSSGIDTSVFLIVGGILLLLIIGLVVIVFLFQQRNKSLLNQVKHVSFQQTNNSGNADPNLLLQKSQQSQ